MRPPRIVFVNRYYWPDQSATSQLLTDLTSALVLRGLDVHVVCSSQLYGNPDASLPRSETAAGVRVHRVRTTRFGRGQLLGRALDYASFYVTCAVHLLRLLKRGDVLVAKTDPPLVSLLAAPIARWHRALLVNWQQDIFPEAASRLGVNPLPPWLDDRLKQLRDASLRAATMNVSIGSRMQQYLTSRGISESKLCVIENWATVDGSLPKSTTESDLRGRLDLRDRFVVCYSGNLGRAHEFETLLGAAQALAGDPTFVFLIIGDGAKMPALKLRVDALRLGNFRFLPHQPRHTLQDSLAAGDVHVVSLLPALEGMILPSKFYGILGAARAPIFIGDPDGELARVIDAARCGRVVPVGDSGALVDTLRSLAGDPDEVVALGARARQLLRERYDFKRALDQWSGLIDKLLI